MLKLVSYQNITPMKVNHGNTFYNDPLKTEEDLVKLVRFLADIERMTIGHCDVRNINITNIIPLNMD